MDWADLALMVAIVVAGSGVSYWLVMRRVGLLIAESHREMERRLQELTKAVIKDEPEVVKGVSSPDSKDAKEMEAKPIPFIQGRPLPRIEVRNEPRELEEIAPEIHAAIAAAAIATLGNHARVRVARRVPSQDVVSPWTQQGRVIVQSSHNLRARGR